MDNNLLKLLGLTDIEIKIYKRLCEADTLTLAGIARHTGIHRPKLYKILPKMVEKKFLTERMVGKRIYYKAIEPRFLYDALKEQTDNLVTEIDELQGLYEKNKQKPDIEFYLGQGGYKKLFDDIADVVPKGGQIFRYSARRLDDTNYDPSSAYKKRRAQGHFERLAITSEAKGVKKSKRIDRFVKVVPKSYDLFDDHVSQTIYEDRVVFTDHEHETTFIIKSEKIAGVQKKLFKLLWKHLPEPKN